MARKNSARTKFTPASMAGNIQRRCSNDETTRPKGSIVRPNQQRCGQRLGGRDCPRSLLKNSLAVAFRSIQTSSQYAWRRPTTIQCVQLCVAGGSGARGSSASGDPEVGG